MRKRHLILIAFAFAAALAAFGTVVAQQPQLPSSGPPVRPADQWTPNPAQPGLVQPAGGVMTPPAGYNQSKTGVIPASGIMPPPSLDVLTSPPAAPATPPAVPVTGTGFGAPGALPPSVPAAPTGFGAPGALPPSVPAIPAGPGAPGALPPPSVTQDPVLSPSFPTTPVAPVNPVVPVPGLNNVSPVVPPATTATPPATTATPPIGGPGLSAVPVTPAAPTSPGVAAPNRTFHPGASGDQSPSAMPVRPAVATNNALPGRVVQNVVLETICPESVVFGQEFRYELLVKNSGTTMATGVRVEDELPSGAKYVGSDPPAEVNGDRLSWVLGTIDGGAEKRIVVRVKPTDEGEVRSRATVTFATSVDARTKVTRPRVSVTVTSSEVCRAGEETIFTIKVGNSGSGPAQRMVLQAKLSDGLLHPQGMVIEAELANLASGETKTIPLKVSAAKAGLQKCQITVAAEGSPDATGTASVNVIEPLLQVSQTGPTKCHVRAEPSYEITLSNPGTAPTDPISLYSVLPEGFEFVQANENGAYVAANRAVMWKLAGLPSGGTKTVSLKMRAAAAGDGSLRTIAQAIPESPVIGTVSVNGAQPRPTGRVLEQKTETAIKAEGVAAIKFEVTDLEDPVEIGKEAVYEIRVTNQGTGACTNVVLVAALAEGTTYTGSSGPTQVKAQGQHLIFDPIQQLGVKGEAVYRVRVKSSVAGDLRFRVQLQCDQIHTPVVKEESTNFYKE